MPLISPKYLSLYFLKIRVFLWNNYTIVIKNRKLPDLQTLFIISVDLRYILNATFKAIYVV